MNETVFAGTVAMRLVEKIRNDIISGRLASGSTVTIKELAEYYGVSHIPVREALQKLEGERLLEMIPYKGGRILRVDRLLAENAYDVCESLERLLVKSCMQSGISAYILNKAGEINDRILEIADDDGAGLEYVELNDAFHETVLGASPNTNALDYYRHNQMFLSTFRRYHEIGPQQRRQGGLLHRRVIECMKAGDLEGALSATSRHVMGAKTDLLRHSFK